MSILLADIIRWGRQHIKLAPLLSVGGTTNQPGLDFCQDVMNTILTKGYNWQWNRFEVASVASGFTTTDGVWAYEFIPDTIAVPTDDDPPDTVDEDLLPGWLERCYIERYQDTADPPERQPIEVVQRLAVPFYKGIPRKIALDKATSQDFTNGAGIPEAFNIGDTILRMDPIPDATRWTVHLEYQAAPRNLSTNYVAALSTFDPIPDRMVHIIRQLFLAHAYRMVDDRRSDTEMRKGLQMLEAEAQIHDMEESNEGFYPDRPMMDY